MLKVKRRLNWTVQPVIKPLPLQECRGPYGGCRGTKCYSPTTVFSSITSPSVCRCRYYSQLINYYLNLTLFSVKHSNGGLKKTLPFKRVKPFSATTDPPADGWLGNRGGEKRASREGQKEAVDIFQGWSACVVACSP